MSAMKQGAISGDSVDILVFLIPCLQFVQLQIVGVLNGSDLLLLGIFIIFALREQIRISTPDGKRLLVLGSLWLASQCVTDIVRHTAFADYARGWSNIGMTLVNFAVIWTLLYRTTAAFGTLRVGACYRKSPYNCFQSR